MTHLIALGVTLALYSLLALAFLGWGTMASAWLELDTSARVPVTLRMWLGWAVTLLIWQVAHFALPVRAYVVLPVLIVGIARVMYDLARGAMRPIALPRLTLLRCATGIAIACVVLWIASRAMVRPANYDSGLYHYNNIRWLTSLPIVPGLGNLHGRLAFNSAFFTFVGALNLEPLFGHGTSVANSSLWLLATGTMCELLAPCFRNRSQLFDAHPFRYLSPLLCLPVLAFYALESNGLFSPSPDLTSSLLQLVIFALFTRAIADWTDGETPRATLSVVAVLAATAITVKLSSVAYGAVMLGCAAIILRATHAPRLVGRLGAWSVGTVVVWCGQTFVLSGVPVFPSTLGYVAANWAMPAAAIANEANVVAGWARAPEHWRTAPSLFGSWHWFLPWLGTFMKDVTDMFPLIAGALLCAVAWKMSHATGARRITASAWSILLPSVGGIAYWFLAAPDPRFAQALFFTLLIASSLLVILSARGHFRRYEYVTLCIALGVVTNFHFARFVRYNSLELRAVSTSGWQPVPVGKLRTAVTNSGLTVYVTVDGDQSWDAPLPATPFFNAALRLRDGEHLSSGFTLAPGH